MPDFNLPLSGAVAQVFKAWAAFLSPLGNQVGLINVNLGKSSNPTAEEQIISDVASYGKQLGRIEDALAVVLKYFSSDHRLTEEERKPINALERMIEEIASVKERYSPLPGTIASGASASTAPTSARFRSKPSAVHKASTRAGL